MSQVSTPAPMKKTPNIPRTSKRLLRSILESEFFEDRAPVRSRGPWSSSTEGEKSRLGTEEDGEEGPVGTCCGGGVPFAGCFGGGTLEARHRTEQVAMRRDARERERAAASIAGGCGRRRRRRAGQRRGQRKCCPDKS